MNSSTKVDSTLCTIWGFVRLITNYECSQQVGTMCVYVIPSTCSSMEAGSVLTIHLRGEMVAWEERGRMERRAQ